MTKRSQTGLYRNWTIAEEQYLIDNYKKIPAKKLANWMNRSINSVYIRANLLGLRSEVDYRKHSFDETFFATYTPLSCYWAGFIAADGSVINIKNKKGASKCNVLGIEIAEDYHLAKFKNDIRSTYPIAPSSENTLFATRLTITAQVLQDLEQNFNITYRKTFTLQFPHQIPDTLKKYFVMGFIDGDGCWNLNYANDLCSVSIGCASRQMLVDLNDWISINYPVKATQRKRNIRPKSDKPHISILSIGGKVACQLYLDLRKELPETRLARKWDRPDLVEHCENYLKKFPLTSNMV